MEVHLAIQIGSCGATGSGGEAARVPGAAEEVGGREDLFAWLGQARRLAKDYERLPERPQWP
jgi:hypothetical protein